MDKQTAKQFTVGTFERNIMSIVNTLTIEEMQADNWYTLESRNIEEMSIFFGIPKNIIAGMVTLTSPLQKWEQNLQAVINIIMDGATKKRYGMKANENKAKKLLAYWVQNGDVSNDWILENAGLGDKTGCFFMNLADPKRSRHFTVDVWMIRAAFGAYMSATNKLPVSKRQIDSIREVYLEIFEKLELEKFGIMPHQLQAAVWITIKDKSVMSWHFSDYANFADVIR